MTDEVTPNTLKGPVNLVCDEAFRFASPTGFEPALPP